MTCGQMDDLQIFAFDFGPSFVVITFETFSIFILKSEAKTSVSPLLIENIIVALLTQKLTTTPKKCF